MFIYGAVFNVNKVERNDQYEVTVKSLAFKFKIIIQSSSLPLERKLKMNNPWKAIKI